MKRVISQKIQKELTNHKVILIVGQRQVGKTWELKRLMSQNTNKNCLFFDFEDEAQRLLFNLASVDLIETIIGNRNQERLLLLDEVQYLRKAGSVLKLIHDHFPATKVVATGSASFLMLKDIGDSLYGRHTPFTLYPLTLREMVNDADNFDYEIGGYRKLIHKPMIDAQLKNLLLFGSLPEIFLTTDKAAKKESLKGYIRSLLFKDIFEIEGIRLPQVFKRLLTLLALQVGHEVNANELSTQLEISRKTVLEYIDLYEKFKIISTLRSYSQNPRKEIAKGLKVYFTDLGIRNTLINNFNPLETRADVGALFENLVFNIFLANLDYYNANYRLFFWRSFTQAEVDLVLVDNAGGKLIPIEIKYAQTKKPSRSFLQSYQEKIALHFNISRENLWQFI